MVFVVDNYDSFTYNIVQILGQYCQVKVGRNDELELADIIEQDPSAILISPGPGSPSGAGISKACIEYFLTRKPILGVCLGHQAIAEVLGGEVVQAERQFHGKSSRVYHAGQGLFQGVSSPFQANRYHSLIVPEASLSHTPLNITAWTSYGEVMAVAHKELPVFGVQFHPESFETPEGVRLLQNFISGYVN